MIESLAERPGLLTACNFIPNGNWLYTCLSEPERQACPLTGWWLIRFMAVRWTCVPGLRSMGMPMRLPIACTDAVCVQTPGGSYLLAEAREIDAALIKEQDWRRLEMSQGTKGPRMFDWAILPVVHQGIVDGRHWLLIRRCIDDPDEKTYYLLFALPATTLQKMVSALGARWHIEEDLEATKDLGLDQYEVRSFIGWYRHITLVLLAYAFLVGIRVHDKSHLPANAPSEQAEPSRPLLPLTTSEARHLLARLFFPVPSHARLVQAWSQWRRQHQYWASYYHSRQRENRRIALSVACDQWLLACVFSLPCKRLSSLFLG